MKTITKKQIKAMHPLAMACYRQIGADSVAEFIEKMIDVSNHGANTGWNGFTYSIECQKFFKSNKKAIIAQLKNDSEELGKCMLEIVKSFNCLHNNFSLEEIGEAIFSGKGDSMIFDALAWYALESVANFVLNEVKA